ncbi:MAG: hypothetical protein P4N60_07175, partial [Verrucomicrobiae bacterium]|nr:hypothetical protein [Verrucomicrobiae bacterium]
MTTLPQLVPSRRPVAAPALELFHPHHITRRQPLRRDIRDRTVSHFRQLIAVRMESFHDLPRLLLLPPLRMTAMPPFKQIMSADGFAAELLRHHRPDLRQRVQPFQERRARFMVGQPLIHFLPDCVWQPGDFPTPDRV